MEDYIEDVLESNDLAMELLDALDMDSEYLDLELSKILRDNSKLFESGNLFTN